MNQKGEEQGSINAYEKARNQLIPQAKKHANRKVRHEDFEKEIDYNAAWSRAFHREMNRLAYETGLVGWR